MSDTLNNPDRFKDCPRTNAGLRLGSTCRPDHYYIPADLGDELERELTLAQSELAKTQSERAKAEAVCETLRKAQAFIKSEQDDEVAILRADADRKTALIVELREKLVTEQQRVEQLTKEREMMSQRVLRWQEFAVPQSIELRELKLHTLNLHTPAPSLVCRYCGKVESEHGIIWKWCDMTMGSEVFTPISPEPISTKGGDPSGALDNYVPDAAQDGVDAAPVAVRSSDGERQETENRFNRYNPNSAGGMDRDESNGQWCIWEVAESELRHLRATAQNRVSELEKELAFEKHIQSEGAGIVQTAFKERDAAHADVARLKTERDGALHSSENWELLHAKRHGQLEVALADVAGLRDDQDKRAKEYGEACNQLASLHTQLDSAKKDVAGLISARDAAVAEIAALNQRIEDAFQLNEAQHKRLDLARRQIAAMQDALQRIATFSAHKDADTLPIHRAANAALLPASARLYVRREVLEKCRDVMKLMHRATLENGNTKESAQLCMTAYQSYRTAIANAESELAGGAE